ncbi:hypothetical protein [Pseudidiomarina aestuarii]|nr:hypothetical protein [Pseudidiomarina aestuarii]
MNCLKLLSLAAVVLLSNVALSEEKSVLELAPGYYEGIFKDYLDYKTLVIDVEGNYALVTSKMASGFRLAKALRFSRDDVVCSDSSCIISISRGEDDKRPVQILMRPSVLGWDVVESRTIGAGETVHYSYELQSNNKTPIPAQFFNSYKSLSEPTSPNNDRYAVSGSVYIGYSEGDGSPNLIVVEFQGDNKALVQSFVNDMESTKQAEYNVERMSSPTNGRILTQNNSYSGSHIYLYELLEHKLIEGFDLWIAKDGSALQTRRIKLIRVNPHLKELRR